MEAERLIQSSDNMKRIRHNYDARLFKYERIKKPSDSSISFLYNKIFVADCYMENCGFWTHEYTELSILRILNKWKYENSNIKFKGYKITSISHFISKYGKNNGRCLEPLTRKNRAGW